MVYNSIISLRSSLYYNNNNNNNNYSNERCPSSCCSCCCSFPVNSTSRLLVPIINHPTSYLYGLRQSTLIQWPASRRLILGSVDRYCYRAPVCNVGQSCCGKSSCFHRCRVERVKFEEKCKEKCCVKKRSSDVNRVRGRVASVNYRCSALGDAEALLSLLTDEMVGECIDVRERRRRSLSKGGNVAEEGSCLIEEGVDRKEKSGSGNLVSRFDRVLVESGRIQSGEDCKRRERRETLENEEVQRPRRTESSSSYYSLSDLDEFESDEEVELQEGGYGGESSTRHEKDKRKTRVIVSSEEAQKDSRRYRSVRDEQLERSKHDDLRVESSAARKKSEGVVIGEECIRDSKWSQDYVDEKLNESVHDEYRASSSTEWDWRKKSEKKLTADSAEEIRSKKASVTGQSEKFKGHESGSTKASSSTNKFYSQEDQAYSRADFQRQSTSHITKDNRATEYSKSSNRQEQSVQSTDLNRQRISNQVGDNLMVPSSSVQETGCGYCKTCGGTMQEKKIESTFEQDSEVSEIQESRRSTLAAQNQSKSRLIKQGMSTSLQSSLQDNVHAGVSKIQENRRSTLAAQNQSESRLTRQGMSTSLQSSLQEEYSQHDLLLQGQTGQGSGTRVSQESQRHSETVETQDTHVESIVLSQQQSESHMNTSERNSVSLESRQSVKELREKSDRKVSAVMGSSSVSQTGMAASQVQSMHVKIGQQSTSDQKIFADKLYLTSKEKTVEETIARRKVLDETIERRKVLDETIVRSRHRTEVLEPIPQAGLTEGVLQKATVSQPSVGFITQTAVPESSEAVVESDLQLSTVSSGELLGTTSNYVHRLGKVPLSGEVSGSRSTPYGEPSLEDALGSAERMEESSVEIVDEFVETIRQDTSGSKTRLKKSLSEPGLKQKNGNYELGGSNQSDSDKKILQKQQSKRSVGSSGTNQSDSDKKILQKQQSKRSVGSSGTKGPPDEMWDVKDHFSQEPSEIDTLEGATSETAVARRSGKSLWNIVSGILRLRWGSPSETQKSPVKEGGRRSSNESASSDSSFSGNEAGDTNVENRKNKQTILPQDPSSAQPIRRISSYNQQENLMSSGVKAEAGAASSSSGLQTGLISGGVTSGDITSVTSDESQPTPSLDLTVTPARLLRRSPAFDGIKEAGEDERQMEIPMEEGSQSIVLGQTGISSPEAVDAELKRSKLQRSNRVLQERFDAWEDAYKYEYEQRKVDEIFMREALVEAKKAADSWEVPVGAVLVQNGTVIARGYNLVEELRDSTAHAEMNCIRQASSTLRTWRLSETTLYVTLEPCPMCAGAILQARIGSVVWGAPNRLLGADGSWIRLFPDDVGQQRPEVVDKPAAPVHPFHPNIKIRRGVLEAECGDIMQQFFQLRRKKQKKAEEKQKKAEEAGQPSCLPVPHNPSKLLHKMHDKLHFLVCL